MTDTRTIMNLSSGSDEDKLYEGALNAVLHMDKRDYPSYVGGLKVASGMDFKVFSPIDNSIIFGNFQLPEEGLVERAVEVAKNAQKTWAKTSLESKIEIISKVLDNIERQRYRLSALLTVCAGMTRAEAYDEIDTLFEVVERAIFDAETIKSKPLGVWAIVSDYNSPLASPIGYAIVSILAGNSVILVPSKYVPVPVFSLYDILVQSGLPDGVLNIIVDAEPKTSTDLVNNLDVAGIVVSGSGNKMEDLMFLQGDEDLSFICEVKGLNPIFSYRPSNYKDAAKKIVKSAFSYAGQRLDSCSKVVVTMNEQNHIVNAILDEVKSLVIDDPAEIKTTMGPIISEEQYKLFESLVSENKDYLIYGGKRIVNDITSSGYYVSPAIFLNLPEEAEINIIDFSLPILSIVTVPDIESAIDNINMSEYGLSAGIITKESKIADQFISEINADEIFVNDASVVIGAASKAIIKNF